MMKATYNKSRIMKMAHVRRKVDKMMFGSAKGDFAYYLRGAWASVKEEQTKACEDYRIAEMRHMASAIEVDNDSFAAGCLAYYAEAPRGTYFGD